MPRPVFSTRLCFSALQRAENSSIGPRYFVCYHVEPGFSALQRAENSSIHVDVHLLDRYNQFQCSSASRKFLNVVVYLSIVH